VSAYRIRRNHYFHIKVRREFGKKVVTYIFTFSGQDYLITIDYLNNYFEIDRLPSKKIPDVIYVIYVLKHGAPSVVFSDGAFACQKFRKFADSYEFEH